MAHLKNTLTADSDQFNEVGNRTYTLNDSIVTCLIQSVADNFESQWIGEIHSGFIQFTIENPDFEGKYIFTQQVRNA